jgi:ParB family chromosome partitioning protein
MGHARALLPLAAAEQVMAAQTVVARKLSVRETEALVARQARGTAAAPAARKAAPAKSRDLLRLEESLADRLSAAVEIRLAPRARKGAQPGEIVVRFHSLDELSGVLQRLGVAEA